MRIKNYTSFPTEKIREIIRFTCPPGVTGFDITIKNTLRGNRGRAYFHGCSLHDRPCQLVTLHLDLNPQFPLHWQAHDGYLPKTFFAMEDVVVYLVAHELRHLWQARVPRGRRVWGARGQFSERDASAYGIQQMRAWRRYIPESSSTTRFVAAPARNAA